MAVHHSLEVLDGRCDDDGHPRRTGTAWTCAAHIITAVIGSGVLSLAWSVAQLGWVVGPAYMFCFALVTYVSAALLADCYRRGDPEKGPRNRSYQDAVRVYLGILYRYTYIRVPVVSLLAGLASIRTKHSSSYKRTTRETSELNLLRSWCGFMALLIL
ncbi:amino acid permease 4-like [Miscanthus floridulus]|uniref:amino acid permease 4-like n=1 Tax=Miscanthus floridulus TaxID=154761 RepID=UPI003457FA3C